MSVVIPAEVNKQFEIDIKLSNINGNPTKRPCIVGCNLKSLANFVDPTTVECQVNSAGVGGYRILCTPSIRGRHELIVTVDGLEVNGSPFPVFVSIHPSLLDKPVRVISLENRPYDVTVTMAGDIVVTISGCITVFDRHGKFLRTLDMLQHGVNPCRGITVDNTDGCLYSAAENKIVKLSPELDLLSPSFTGGGELVLFRHLTIVGDQVAVCERNTNVIFVYTKDLKYVKQRDMVSIRGLASDADLNIYCCDHSKKSIQVFGNDWKLCAHFARILMARTSWKIHLASMYLVSMCT